MGSGLENVKYLMGADPNGAVSRLFGVYVDGAGLALRGTLIINPEGTLLSSDVSFFNVGRNIDELMRKFKANLYVARKQAEACPCPVERRWRQNPNAGPRARREGSRSSYQVALPNK